MPEWQTHKIIFTLDWSTFWVTLTSRNKYLSIQTGPLVSRCIIFPLMQDSDSTVYNSPTRVRSFMPPLIYGSSFLFLSRPPHSLVFWQSPHLPSGAGLNFPHLPQWCLFRGIELSIFPGFPLHFPHCPMRANTPHCIVSSPTSIFCTTSLRREMLSFHLYTPKRLEMCLGGHRCLIQTSQIQFILPESLHKKD